MRRCRTCGIPLWMAWLLFASPWKRRMVPFRRATDCTQLLAHDAVEGLAPTPTEQEPTNDQ